MIRIINPNHSLSENEYMALAALISLPAYSGLGSVHTSDRVFVEVLLLSDVVEVVVDAAQSELSLYCVNTISCAIENEPPAASSKQWSVRQELKEGGSSSSQLSGVSYSLLQACKIMKNKINMI